MVTRYGKAFSDESRYGAAMARGREEHERTAGTGAVRGRLKAFARDPRRLALVGLGVVVAYSAFSYESDLNVERPAVLQAENVAQEQAGPTVARGPARRVVWVLVDGLRLDASRTMPILNRLRAEGEDVSARSEFPTFSGPNFVAQASGIEPAASGVLSNAYPGEVPLDSVFRRAKLAGLRTAIRATDGDSGVEKPYGSWIDDIAVGEPEDELPAADLVFLHFGFVDWAAHGSGSQSDEYRADVARADAAIGRIARSLDPTRDALVVTSDHGNLDQGGHGGTEHEVRMIPIVVWGAGAVRRAQAGRGRDVGPTIAGLLGVGPLTHATGRSLIHGDAAAARQRRVAHAVVHRSGASHVDYVPLAIPVAVATLLLIRGGRRPRLRRVLRALPYALAFTLLVAASGTTSFSVSNDSALFSLRLTALCAAAALAQLFLGGRASLGSAALVASLAVLGMAMVAARQPLAPIDGTLRFLPIPAITGLAFVCLVSAALGRRDEDRAAHPIRDSRSTIDATKSVEIEDRRTARSGAWAGAAATDIGATSST
jgi:hypothetical protein